MRPRARAIASVAVSTALLVAGGPAAPVAAQARAVLVAVRALPSLPVPGDDVTIEVSIQGCPPGPAAVELLAESDDGVSRTTEVMARAPARTSMVWSSRATMDLPDAPQGWYGVRVICGTFRPPREPLASTRFVVGAKPTAMARLETPEVAAGGTVTLTGTGCLGGTADAQLMPSADALISYVPDDSVPVQPDGSWRIDLPVNARQKPGRMAARARCLATNQYGRQVPIPYEDWLVVTITG